MKNIAVLTSNDAPRGLELATFFNGGARYRVVLLLTDNSHAPALMAFSLLGIPAASASPEEWALNPSELLRALEEAHVDIIALDNFNTPLPKELTDRYAGRIVTLDESTGAREILARFPDEFSTEGAWADALGMEFDPETAATPPAIPVPPAFPGAQQHPSNVPEPPRQAAFRQGPAEPQVKEQRNGAPDNRPMPKTYLIWSVIATLVCCMAAGIVAIIFSAKVSSRYYAGDYEGAERASRMAQGWIIASIVVGVVTNAIYFPLTLLS